jgi:murein DD-endopeptidase MepM/ murein hydrolase activator NlpD
VRRLWVVWRRRLTGRVSSGGSLSPALQPPARCELQFHSGARRGRVYYLRLGRTYLTVLSVVVLLYLFLVAFAAGMAPGVVGAVLGGAEYRSLAAERGSQGVRLHALETRLEEMRSRSEAQLLAVRKVARAYDLPPGGSGAGGRAAERSARVERADRADRPVRPVRPDRSDRSDRSDRPDRGEGVPAEGPGVAEAPAGAIYGVSVAQSERLRQRIEAQIGALETTLAAVRAFEEAHPEVVRETPAACPLRGDLYVLSNPFGRQRSAFTRTFAFHGGIDLAAPAGTPIHAAADGVVVFAGTYPLGRSPVWWRYGSLVVVAHGDRYLTLYGHCGEIRTAAGKGVRRGDELAAVGSSGWSLSPHLHYEVRKLAASGEMVPVDPLLYIFDRRWPGEERLVSLASSAPRAGDYEPLPPGLGRPGSAARAASRHRPGGAVAPPLDR